MEQYLKDLKPTKDGIYTLPKNKYDELLKRYSLMKNEIHECAKHKQDYLYAIEKYQENKVLLLQLERDKNMEIMKLNKQIKEMSENMATMNQKNTDLIRIATELNTLLQAEKAKNEGK